MPGTTEVVLRLLLSLAYMFQVVLGQSCAPGTYVPPRNPTACLSCPAGTFNDLPNSTYPITLHVSIPLYVKGITEGHQIFMYSRLDFLSQPLYYPDFGLGIQDLSLFRHPNQNWYLGRRNPLRGYWESPIVSIGDFKDLAQSGVNGGHCFFCPRGTYQPISGQTSCRQCPFGTYTDAMTPATYCRPCMSPTKCCAPGTYLRNPYDTSCSLCPANTFNADLDQTACKPCPPGTTSAPGSVPPDSCKTNSPTFVKVITDPNIYLPVLTQDQRPPTLYVFNTAPTHRHYKTTRDTAYLSLVISAVIIMVMTWWTREKLAV